MTMGLPPLQPDVHFVAGDLDWVRALQEDDVDAIDLKTLSHSPSTCWVGTTCYRWKQAGLPCTISDQFRTDALNVCIQWDLPAKARLYRYFIAACRSDGPTPWHADAVLVQNPLQHDGVKSFFVPHWPQPDLLPRNLQRGNTIQRIVFVGTPNNLWTPFHSASFNQALAALGVQLVMMTPETGTGWTDYTQADLVLAVRSLTQTDYWGKPASKLVNAWIAGVPAILGPEPAFRALRRSRYDYYETQSPDAVIAFIRHLQSHPQEYNRYRDQCALRADDFTTPRMVERWAALLYGPIGRLFLDWHQHRRRRVAAAMATYPLAYLRRLWIDRRYRHDRDLGYRPFEPHNP
jgi:hypothetical protein